MPNTKPDHTNKKRDPTHLPSGNRVGNKKENYHVVPRERGWVVIGGSDQSIRATLPSQQEAIKKARDYAQQNAAVVIHARDGKIIGREVFRDRDWELVADSPETDAAATEKHIELGKYIDTTYFGERPHVRGRRVLVSMIAANAERDKLSAPELAYEFSLSEQEILAALLYYREHKAEVDRQDVEEQEKFEEMYKLYGGQNDP